MARLTQCLVAVAVLAGCESPVVSVDGGVDAGPVDAAVVVTAPTLPAPPALPTATCPEGWSTTAPAPGVVACAPWTTRPVCAAGERLAAGAGCVPIADDCGTDAPPEVATGAALVVPGATGGDGSALHPFGTIEEALARGGAVIALGPGEHAMPATLDGRTLVGTCPGVTTLRITGTATLRDATLRRLTVVGAALAGAAGGTLTLEHVELAGLTGGIVVAGALVARATEIRDLPVGILASRATSVVLEDVAIEHLSTSALDASGGSGTATVSLTRVVVDRVAPPDVSVAAVLLGPLRSLAIDGLVVENVGGHALAITTAAATVHDVWVHEAMGGALLLSSSTPTSPEPLRVARVWAADLGGGVVLGPGTLEASDVVVSRSHWLGVDLYGALGTVERVWIDGAVEAGLDVAGVSDVTVRDVVVRNVRHDASDNGGALLGEERATLRVERALLEHADHYGLAVTDGAHVVASDVEITTIAAIVSDDGFGAIVNLGSDLALERAEVHDVFTTGVGSQGGTLQATDLSVHDVQAMDGQNGVGILAGWTEGDPPAVVTLTRADVRHAVRWGVIAIGAQASIDATDLRVDTTTAAPCCDTRRGGAALVVHGGGTLHADSFVLHAAEYAGLVATAGVSAMLTRGRIEENLIGLVISPMLPYNQGSFPGLVMHDVTLDGNGTPQSVTDVDVAAPHLVLR